ncbi:MAG: 50S ribosomal protein L24 [Pseudomonadota bacterium]
MKKIRKGDEVVIVAGKDKGRRSTVVRIFPNHKLLVENVNVVKKHVKPNPQAGNEGGIVDVEMPIHLSNVMLFDPTTGKGGRVGFKQLEDGRKVRYFKSNGEVVDV